MKAFAALVGISILLSSFASQAQTRSETYTFFEILKDKNYQVPFPKLLTDAELKKAGRAIFKYVRLEFIADSSLRRAGQVPTQKAVDDLIDRSRTTGPRVEAMLAYRALLGHVRAQDANISEPYNEIGGMNIGEINEKLWDPLTKAIPGEMEHLGTEAHPHYDDFLSYATLHLLAIRAAIKLDGYHFGDNLIDQIENMGPYFKDDEKLFEKRLVEQRPQEGESELREEAMICISTIGQIPFEELEAAYRSGSKN